MTALRTMAGLAVAAVIASACASSPDEGPTAEGAPAAEGGPVRVLTTPLLSHAPLFIAEDAGFFDEAGVATEVVAGQRAPELIPLLERGELDVWAGSPTPALYTLIRAGVPIRIVADKGYINEDCAYFSYVARKDAAEDPDWGTADGMRDLRFGRPAPVSIGNLYTDAALGAIGLSQDDVQMVDLPFPAAVEAVASGQVDLGLVVEPQLTAALQDPDLVVWRPSHVTLPGAQTAVVVFGPRLIEQDRELGERFVAAYLDGVRRYNEGPTAENLDIVQERTSVEREVLESACWPAIQTDGEVDLDSIVAAQEWTVDQGMQDEVVVPDAFWDPGFIDAVEDQP